VTPVADPTPGQQAWAALGAELTPAKSLQRLDAATARVVSTVGVVATLLTGFGLVAAGVGNLSGGARGLAAVSVGLAFLAVLLALVAQTLTVTRGLNTNDLVEVRRWYTRRFERRAPLTAAATVVLVLAAAFAGLAAILTVTKGPDRPTFAVTRTIDPAGAPVPGPPAPGAPQPGASGTSTVTVEVTFRGLDDGQVASATVTVDGAVVAEARFSPGPDGTAVRTLTVAKVPAGGVAVVEAWAGGSVCTATLGPGTPAAASCTGA
jgi:hypothetical protein